jgi:hypothetical protein
VDSKYGSSWEGGVLVSLLRRMEWVYGRILGKVGGRFVVTPDLKWVMVPRLNSSMTCGVGYDLEGCLPSFIWYCLRKGCSC